jgi:hypothetical protein
MWKEEEVMKLLPGVLLLFVFSWAYLVEETAYVRTTPGPRQEEA